MLEGTNRVAADLNLWRKREERLEALFPGTLKNNKPFLEEKLRYLYATAAKFKDADSIDEKLTLRILRDQREQLERALNPNWLFRFILQIVRSYRADKEQANRSNNNIAIAAITNRVGKMGFSSVLPKLTHEIQRQGLLIELPMTVQVNQTEKVDYKLELKQQDNGKYELNGFHASLTDQDKPSVSRYFSIVEFPDISTELAYNLLSGRAIRTQFQDEHNNMQAVWKQLDFLDKDAAGNHRVREFHSGYGFDVEKELSKLPMVDGEMPASRILQVLADGNKIPVTLNINGNPQQVFIEADPKSRSINIYEFDRPEIRVIPEGKKGQHTIKVIKTDAQVSKATSKRLRIS